MIGKGANLGEMAHSVFIFISQYVAFAVYVGIPSGDVYIKPEMQGRGMPNETKCEVLWTMLRLQICKM